jgi:protein phosphatase
MGTTLVAVMETSEDRRNKGIAVASVGDSRAWILENHKLRAITEDQTWVQEVGRPLGLDDASLKRHPMRHVLTMAIGVNATVRIRCYAVEIQPDALILLSSDGLHGVIGDEEIERILDNGTPSLQEKCRLLVGAANDAGSPDNVTVLLIRQKPDATD